MSLGRFTQDTSLRARQSREISGDKAVTVSVTISVRMRGFRPNGGPERESHFCFPNSV